MSRPGRSGTARTIAIVLAVVTGLYLVAIAGRAWALITTDDVIAVVLGVAILALPLIGVWILWSEISFGVRTAQLGRALEASGGLPEDDLPKLPSGRVVREAADERFAVRQAGVEASPDDWGAWFRLSVAYDDAGDRKRARESMRTAIDKFDASS